MTERETEQRDREAVRQVLWQFVPAWSDAAVSDDTTIAPGGLNLDSVAVVELLVACEARFGVAFPDHLLATPPLTVGDLVRHVRAARPES